MKLFVQKLLWMLGASVLGLAVNLLAVTWLLKGLNKPLTAVLISLAGNVLVSGLAVIIADKCFGVVPDLWRLLPVSVGPVFTLGLTFACMCMAFASMGLKDDSITILSLAAVVVVGVVYMQALGWVKNHKLSEAAAASL